jgi:hypothetical protein
MWCKFTRNAGPCAPLCAPNGKNLVCMAGWKTVWRFGVSKNARQGHMKKTIYGPSMGPLGTAPHSHPLSTLRPRPCAVLPCPAYTYPRFKKDRPTQGNLGSDAGYTGRHHTPETPVRHPKTGHTCQFPQRQGPFCMGGRHLLSTAGHHRNTK